MNKSKGILSIVFFLIAFTLLGQEEKKIYYDKNWQVVKNADDADYYRIVKFDKDNKPVGRVKDYYKSGQLQSEIEGALLIDSADDKKSIFIGKTKRFYYSGEKETEEIRDVKGQPVSVKEWYMNGSLWYEIKYLNGKKNGVVRYAYDNGMEKAEIPYVNDKREGHAKWYYESGKIKEEATFLNDSLNGEDIQYFDEVGVIMSKALYKYGKRNGIDTWYYLNGKVREEALFKNDSIYGDDKHYFENGQEKLTIPYFQGKKGVYTTSVSFYPTGQLKEADVYALPQYTGDFMQYYENGNKMSEIPFVNGKREGTEHHYFPSGRLKYEITYENGLRNGTEHGFYENGKLKNEAKYVNDSIVGESKSYYVSGILMQDVSNRVNGRVDGVVKSYYENGKLSSIYNYTRGKLNGDLILYWPNDTLERRDHYENGKLISGECFDSTGVKSQYTDYKLTWLTEEALTSTEKNLEDVFSIVQKMPSFPEDINEYLKKHIKYPEKELKSGIAGTVYVNFIIEKDGSVSNVKVMREISNGPGLNQEAYRVISNMPKWNPGYQNGKQVRVSYNIPIRFVVN